MTQTPVPFTTRDWQHVFIPERLVHLDLKGAPPKMAFLERFIPLVKRLGATGLLIEYEDSFPFTGELEVVRSVDSYSTEEIIRIVQLCRENDLKAVPLVQTMGHLQFLLKWNKFSHLRANPKYCDTICICNPESVALLKEMMQQVAAFHQDAEIFHIGADEAYRIKDCDACKNKPETSEQLMLAHIAAMAKYVKDTFKIPRVLAWNDTFEKAEADKLKYYNLGELIEPVVWGYRRDVLSPGYFPDGLFDRCAQAFPRVWLGSAFKGANGPSAQEMDDSLYLDNHKSYVALLKKFWKQLENRNPGIIITGWSRYSHLQPLCELLPLAIPSLAKCLQFLLDGGVEDEELNAKVATKLSALTDGKICTGTMPQLYADYKALLAKHEGKFRALPKDPFKVDPIEDDVEMLSRRLRRELSQFFPADAVNEWMLNYFDKYRKEGRMSRLARIFSF